MILAVALFGLFLSALGVMGFFAPERLLALVTRVQSQAGIHAIAGFRLLMAVPLWFAAPESRAPFYLQTLGILSLLSGIATPFFGKRRFAAILGWWRERPASFVRVWSLFVVAFGLSLVWAVFPG